MKKLKDLFVNSRELVILAPLAAAVLWILFVLVAVFTGRPVVVSLVPLSEFGISLLRVVLCGAFAVLFQASALGYRAEKAGGSIWDDIVDAAIFLVLFVLFILATASF